MTQYARNVPHLPSMVRRIVLSLLLVASTSAILYLLRLRLGIAIAALLYLIPVLVGTILWGLPAGITASVGSFLLFNFLFIAPYYTFTVHHSQDVIVLIIFLVVAVVISQLVGRVKTSLANAQSREQEVLHLYELSQRLTNVQHQEQIAQMLVGKLQEVFALRAVELELSMGAAKSPLVIRMSDDPPPAPPDHSLPLLASLGAMGTIRLWAADDHSLNVTEQRLLQALVTQGALALERAVLAESETRAAILEESDKLKSALLSSVSHELRTPLVTIKAAATSLRSGAVERHSAAADELLAALEEESDRMNQLVGDLLNMSRIEAGALKLQRQWNVLAEVVDTSLAKMRLGAAHQQIRIEVSESLPLIPLDAVLMQQVFSNLIGNSFKYAPPQTIIHVAAEVLAGGEMRVKVSNEGPPVPAEHLEHIFDKFHRVTAAATIPGTGLGLSICKGIIEAHGGEIWAENLAEGFAFLFTLPMTMDGNPSPIVPPEPDTL